MMTRPNERGHGWLSDLIVWGTLIAPGIVLNKDGSLQTTYRFRGPDLDSTTTSSLVATMGTDQQRASSARFGLGAACRGKTAGVE